MLKFCKRLEFLEKKKILKQLLPATRRINKIIVIIAFVEGFQYNWHCSKTDKYINSLNGPHMWTLDQGQTQQGDWTMST
jgi:hypothetical protein